VRENFLTVMGITLLSGRTFRPQDDIKAPKVAVVNQTFVNQYFPNENAVGKRFTFDSSKPDEIEIVRWRRMREYTRQRDEIPPTVYSSYRQDKSMTNAVFGAYSWRPTSVLSAVRQAVRSGPNLPLNNIKHANRTGRRDAADGRLFISC
jgi:putative ABC transport system permease protein